MTDLFVRCYSRAFSPFVFSTPGAKAGIVKFAEQEEFMKIATPEEIAQEEAKEKEQALEFTHLPLNQIVISKQIRQDIDTNGEAFKGLVESVRERGVLEPILVARQEDGTFLLIIGERRLRACQMLGLTTIPVRIIKQADTKADVIALQLIENLERENLDPIDEANAYLEFFRTTVGAIDAAGIISLIITYERDPERAEKPFVESLCAIAKITGKTTRSVQNLLSLLTLPTPFRTAVKEEKIVRSQGYLLAANQDLDTQKFYEIFQSILEKPVTYDELKKLLDNARKGKEVIPKPAFSGFYSNIKITRTAFEKGKSAFTQQEVEKLSTELKAFCALLDEQVQKLSAEAAAKAAASPSPEPQKLSSTTGKTKAVSAKATKKASSASGA
jgi:ParB family transcriptional regulator, chromosome partitioning protein